MYGLVKFQRDAHAQIAPFARGVGVCTAAAAAKAAEAAAEQIAKNIAKVHAACAAEAAAKAALPRAVAGVNTGKAVLIVALALFGVTQHLIGLVDLFKFFLGVFIAGVIVRVILHSQLAVGFFDLLRRGSFAQTQDFIIIAFFSHKSSSILSTKKKSGFGASLPGSTARFSHKAAPRTVPGAAA